MGYKTPLVICICATVVLISGSCKVTKTDAVKPSSDGAKTMPLTPNSDGADTERIDALKNVHVDGPSFETPVKTLFANGATEAVVREGQPIIPKLIVTRSCCQGPARFLIVFSSIFGISAMAQVDRRRSRRQEWEQRTDWRRHRTRESSHWN